MKKNIDISIIPKSTYKLLDCCTSVKIGLTLILLSVCIPLTVSATNVTVQIWYGTFAGDNSWNIYDGNGNSVLSGGPGSNDSWSYNATISLTPGVYTVVGYDSWGDGWTGGGYIQISPTTGTGVGPFAVSGAGTYRIFTVGGTKCSGTIWDNGNGALIGESAGNYMNNESWTYNIYPTVGTDKVRLAFSSFNTESSWDYLYLNIGSGEVSYTGTTSPGTVTSTFGDGHISVRFTSDGNTTSSGWAATVSCYSPSPPAVTSLNVSSSYNDKDKALTITGTAFTGATDVKIGGSGGTSLTNITVVTATQITCTVQKGICAQTNSQIAVYTANGWSSDVAADNFTVSVRNTIPVGGGTDPHSTIQSALDGLWSSINCGGSGGNTYFATGATKTIDVYPGTYSGSEFDHDANPTATNEFIIQANSGRPIIDGGTYGLFIHDGVNGVDYTTIKGFEIKNATLDGIKYQGSNGLIENNIVHNNVAKNILLNGGGSSNEIRYNKCYSSTGDDGIRVQSSGSANVHNNLCYDNYGDGISIYASNTCSITNNTCYGNGHEESGTVFSEYFESGTAGWTLESAAGSAEWRRQSCEAYAGTYSCSMYDLSNTIGCDYCWDCGSNPDLNLYRTIDLTSYSTASITYYYKIGGEATYDYGQFYVNSDQKLTNLQGTGGWTQSSSINLNAYCGTSPTIYFRWVYDAWTGSAPGYSVDNIVVTASPASYVGSAFYIDGGTDQLVTNNIFYAKTGGTYYATYVNTVGGATMAVGNGWNNQYSTGSKLCYYGADKDITSWNSDKPGTNDDISADPLFVTDGSDFHLKTTNPDGHSTASWPPATSCTYSGSGVSDGVLSPSIDAGTGSPTNEPSPDGSVINQGVYGNTCQGSKSDNCIAHSVDAKADAVQSITICTGGTVTLTANPTGGADCSGSWEYAWYTGTGSDNTYYNGATWTNAENYNTSWSTVASVGPTSITTYKVRVRCDAQTLCNDEDAVGVTVSVDQEPTTSDAGSDQDICASSGVATMAGNNAAVGTGTWTRISGPNTPNIVDINDETTQIGTVTPMVTGIYVYRWTIANGVCTDSQDDVTITVNDAPTAPTSATSDRENFCTDDAGNISLSVTGGSGDDVGWYTSSCGGTGIGTGSPLVIASPTTTTIYYARWETASCSGSICTNVSVNVYQQPTTAAAGGDQTVCATPGSATMDGNNPVDGTGTWTRISGPNTPNIANANQYNTQIGTSTQMITGIYVYRWTIANGPCTDSWDEVTITVDPAPTTSAAGGDQTICSSPGVVTMAGNNPTTGTGTWTMQSGPNTPNIVDVNLYNTQIGTGTAMIAGTYVYRWTITNGVCTDSPDDVTIIVDPAPTTASAGSNQTICASPGVVTMAGNDPTIGTGTWTRQSGPNTPNIVDVNLYNTQIGTGTAMIAGTYVYRWTIANGVCTDSQDDVTITVDASTVGGTVSDDNACGVTNSGTLTLSGHTGSILKWQWSVSPFSVWNDIANTTTTQNFTNLTETTKYRVQIQNGICSTTWSAEGTVTHSNFATPPDAGEDQYICGTTTTMDAEAGTGTWTVLNGTATITTPGSNTSGITGLVPGTEATLRWTATSGCTSYDDVVITTQP